MGKQSGDAGKMKMKDRKDMLVVCKEGLLWAEVREQDTTRCGCMGLQIIRVDSMGAWVQAESDLATLVYTSGTTGHPKVCNRDA